MGTTIRLSAFTAALALAGQYLAPIWLAAPSLATPSVGSVLIVTPGSVTSVPAAVISYSVTVGGVAKTWPYTPQQSDVGAAIVVTPTATNLGVAVAGPSCSGVVPAFVPQFPSMAIGQNVPADASFSSLRVYNDRVLAAVFFTDFSCVTVLPVTSQDATTGLPTTAFAFKLAQGALSTDPSVTGTWVVNYAAPVQRGLTITTGSGISLISHTFTAGVGKILISYTQNSSALIAAFDGGVTALSCYDPTIFAIWNTGGTPPRYSSQFLGTTPQYDYLRMMDLSRVNGDFVLANSWPDTIEWVDRRTPTNAYLDLGAGAPGGLPIEWQVELCNTANKPGWFCIPLLASDDYVTQFGTYVAQNLNTGLTADFESWNEGWNTAGGFWNYRKAGYAGQTEAVAFKSAPTTDWIRTYKGGCYISTVSSDGTTATLSFSGGTGHGQTVGSSTLVPKVVGANSGYTTFGATGPMTVVDAFTITYPTAQPSTGGAIAATTALASGGFVALNGAAGIFTGANFASNFDFSRWWRYRRAYQVAKLVRDAFAAVGRQASDCRPVLALQAGAGDSAQYTFGAKGIISFIAAQFSGGLLKDRFKAVAFGGYLSLDQGSGFVNSGFGLSANSRFTPQDAPSVLSQLDAMASVAYGCYSYGTSAAWVKDQGLELWGYEIGLDTIGAGGQSTTTQNACTAANGDPGIQPIITKWVQGFVAMGFARIGWFQCGAGSYATFGCFNLGQSAAELTAETPAANQSPKYKGLMAAKTPWTTPQPRHVVPCTLSGYDCVGNEAVITVGGSWPSLSGANLPGGTYPGPNNSGEAYDVWLESQTPQTVTVTLAGDYTTAGAITISAQPCNGAGTGGGSFALSGIHTASTLGSCTVTLQPGPNYVFISASANAANVFPHTVQFA